MNTLILKSCKHQNNTITFRRENGDITVEGNGKDSWTQSNVTIEKIPLESVDITIQRGKGDNDIVIAIESTQGYISAVLGTPGTSGDIYNSRKTYLLFSGIIVGETTLHDSLMSILD